MDADAMVRGIRVGSRMRLLLVIALAAAMTVTTPFVDRAAAAGPAVTLAVSAPATATAGVGFSITVTARDAAGAVATSYRGRVTFTSTDTRSPVLPAPYTFTAADNGRHTFTGVRLFTAGARTVAAFDTVRATVKGRSPVITVAAGTASRLTVTAPATTTAGQPVRVTVTAKDAWFNVAPSYRGTVAMTSTDPRAVLPGAYTFTATDRGTHAFTTVQLRTAGTRTVTVTDRTRTTLTARTPAIAVTHAAPTRLVLTAPATTGSGSELDVVVTAKDPWFNIATGYRGTVRFTSNDPGTETLPGPVTFTAADGGVRRVPGFSLVSAGSRTVTATDVATPTLTGTSGPIVVAATYAALAWGANHDGQLGDGTFTSRATPILVGTDTRWRTVVAGASHTLALRNDGTLWSWGSNGFGQLGNRVTASARPTPAQVGTDTDWWIIATASQTSYGVKTDGTLWSWGLNQYGELGDGTQTNRFAPVPVATDRRWIAVDGAAERVTAIASDGTLWAWGQNMDGLLGDGTTTTRLTPVQLGTADDWISVSVGITHTLAQRSDGSLWSWGWNQHGELGNGTVDVPNLTPTRVGTDTDWIAISAGSSTSHALKVDGTLWGWGMNQSGHLGGGPHQALTTPVEIGDGQRWTLVSTATSEGYAIRSDGSLWTWRPLAGRTQVGLSTGWQAVAAGGNGYAVGLSRDLP